jgi:hypothetical protein
MKRRAIFGLSAALLCASTASAEDTPQRWVTASQVNLRAEPSLQASVLQRLALNTRARLLRTLPEGPFCEIELPAAGGAAALKGFVACQFLGTAAVVRGQLSQPLLPDGSPNPGFNPVRSFWLAPSWAGLEAYGMQLMQKHVPGEPYEEAHRRQPRPSDAEFERMKQHLAKGIHGPKPAPLLPWDHIKAAAPPAPNAKVEQPWNDGSLPQRVIELPSVKPSLFTGAHELAAAGTPAEELSGHFHIVHTYDTRRGRDMGGEVGWVDGLWDIGRVRVALTQPLLLHTLLRDGRILTQRTHASRSQVLWGRVDGPMCEGWLPGFAHGDADPRLWRSIGVDAAARAQVLQQAGLADGALMRWITRQPLPRTQATVQSQQQRLARANTGFVSATQWHFDLDGDGTPDLAVWEGVGHGPGHLDGPTSTDDAWKRVFFVNLAGQWHQLGSDEFAYGCGC